VGISILKEPLQILLFLKEKKKVDSFFTGVKFYSDFGAGTEGIFERCILCQHGIPRNQIPKLTAFRPGQALFRTDDITDQNVVPLKSSYNICTDREMHIKIIENFLFPQKLRLNHAM
jgi:hypothetical protein